MNPPSLVRAFLDHLVVERGLSGHTVGAYRRDLDRYLAHLAGSGIDDAAAIGPAEVAGFARVLAEPPPSAGPPLAPASIARAVAAVRSLHRFAAQEGITPGDPAATIKPPKLPRRLPKALAVAEVQTLLAAPDTSTVAGLRDAALLELLYGTGARVSEITALDVDDVTAALEGGGLRLIGKGDKERVVPLGSYARQAVEAWLVRGRPAWAGSVPALLLNSRGTRLTRQLAHNVLAATGARAGLAGRVTPHALRHSYATHLLDGGADVRVVQELLGHASVTTTQLYTLVTVDQLRDVYLSAHPRAR
ncbi:integrase/recombinase XerD [Naumannella cuiyingiana]|uniref:Tyrosine recombinase XerC n=1 Tax=Naumannella cuiyingiana TaxID=1347891 RepID=A0A7Z0DB95_9ACTN|nr:integrase/recombinase XerD [Naumannella cuiyingiana]